MKDILTKLLLALSLLAVCGTTYAVFDPVNDDTDLFRNNPNIPSERPNVLIALDNTANWSSGGRSTIEKNALVSVVGGLDSSFNVGMMIFTQGGSACTSANVDGGYVRSGIRQMTSTNKAALVAVVNSFTDASCGAGGDQGSSAVGGQMMNEAYLYFAGKTSRSGVTQTKRDYSGNDAYNGTTGAGVTLTNFPLASSSATVYTSPIIDACQKNYIIFISNGPFSNGDDSPSSVLYTALVPGATPIALNPNGEQSSWVDEFAFYLANIGVSNLGGTQFVYSYAVEVDPSTTGQGPSHTALMKSMANQGKGKYFGVTSANSGQAIIDALNSIFTEIQAVNSVFAASTLPVSVNVRGTNLNQLYIGVFRPDAKDLPRWLGNLKAYQLKKDSATGAVFTVDANGTAAINSTTGFITSTAVSFWTNPSLPTANYWSFRPSSANGVGGSSDSPDGDLVEKGGAAQQVRGLYFSQGINGNPTRPLYTCTNGTGLCAAGSTLSSTPFATSNSDIDANALQLATRAVTPLTALQTESVSAITDSRSVSLSNATSVPVTGTLSVTNNSSIGVTLSNSRSVTITGMDNGANPFTGTCSKGSSNTAQFDCTNCGSSIAGNPVIAVSVGTADTKFSTGTGTVSANTQSVTSPAGRLTWGVSGLGNPTTGTCTVTTSNTLTVVKAPSHGFTNGQTVTISGATPSANFGGAKVITVGSDPNSFTFASTVAAAPTLSSPSAQGATSTVTATLASAAPAGTFGLNQLVTIAGANATTPSYNGTFTITAVTVNGSSQTTAFTYATSSAITTASSGTITAAQTASTATITTSAAHGFTDGQSVTITGATPNGYDGTYTISCATSPACAGATTFTYTPGVGLGAPTATAVTASSGTGPTVTGTLAGHGYVAGDVVTIAGNTNAVHNGSFTVLAVPAPTATTFSYTNVAGATVAPTGSPTVRFTNNPLAYATIPSHPYGAAGTAVGNFSILGATPTGYNQSLVTATVVDANTVSYPLTAAQGTQTGTSVTATNYTTTATATSTAHGFVTGATETISGASPSAFNGSFVITVTGADTFTYTLPSAQGAATGTITVTSSGGTSSERDNLINWVRGEDNFEDENSNGSFSDTRASIHGDVLHSRPAVINYNRRTSDTPNVDNDVYIFYGGNDGIFRAVKGGFGSSTGDPSPGAEVWGFLARENFGNLKRLRLNSPGISSSYKKPYFFDGSIGTFTLDNNGDGKLDPSGSSGDKVWLFLTMRRGGRFIYALDVTDPLTPQLLWRKGCPSYETDPTKVDSSSGCDLGWGELGQTWAEPKVVSINASTDPVLMFGAGYDNAVEDADPTCVFSATTSQVRTDSTLGTACVSQTSTRSMGRGLYVVNARTGDIIWQASGHARTDTSTHTYKQVSGMDFSIPSDVAVVVGDPTPHPFRAYVGDTGGQMWRFDFGDASPANWTVMKLGSVADQTVASKRRKFMFPPDVIGDSGYDIVISGTGDREHPFDTVVTNRVYAFKDRQQTTTPPFTSGVQNQATITEGTGNGTPMLDVTSNCIQVPANCTGVAPQLASGGLSASQNTAAALSASTNFGWYLTLASGEKQVGSTLAAGTGAVVFGTNQPSAAAGGGACSPNLGVARQYQVNFENGSAFSGTSVSSIYAGGGYLPSPVLVFVGLGGASGTGSATTGGVSVGGNVTGGQIGIGAGSGLGGGNDPTGVVCYGAACSLAPGKQLYSRLRKFWYKEID